MRKLLLPLFLLFCYGSFSQDAVKKLTRQYFRSDPFATEFSSFLKHLMNDPSLKEKEIYQKTDTSLFFVYGAYDRHSPFFFKPERVEILLAETAVEYADSAKTKDTVFIYKLTAYGAKTAEGLKDVKKEFERIHKNISRQFYRSNHHDEKNGEEVISAWLNYFVPTHALSPVTLLWENDPAAQGPVVTIVVRLKIFENRAVLPASYLFGM